MKKFLIVLSSHKDTYIKLVDGSAKEWLEKPPVFPHGENSVTVNIPRLLRNHEEETAIEITSGSWMNDRALAIGGISFDSIAKAIKYAQEQDMEIIGEFTGSAY